MAVQFNNSDSRTFYHKVTENAGGGAVVSSPPPMSMFCFFNPSQYPTIAATLVAIVKDPPGFGGYDTWRIALTPSSSKLVAATADGQPACTAYSTGTYALNTWHSAGGVFTSNTSRKAYINGVAGTENAGTNNVRTYENTTVGSRPSVTPGYDMEHGFNGCLAKVCIWSSALTDQNMADLHAGTDPATISPSTLVLYMPMVDEATGPDAYAWTGAAVVQISDMLSHTDAGSFATCADSPAAATTNVGAYTRIIGF
jgi:hypothetical protein